MKKKVKHKRFISIIKACNLIIKKDNGGFLGIKLITTIYTLKSKLTRLDRYTNRKSYRGILNTLLDFHGF